MESLDTSKPLVILWYLITIATFNNSVYTKVVITYAASADIGLMKIMDFFVFY